MSNSGSGIWITAVSESWHASVTNHSLVSVPLRMKWHPKGSITPATWGGRAPICDWQPKSDWRRPMLTLASPAERLPASRNPGDYHFLREIYVVHAHFAGTMFAGFSFNLLALWLLVSHSCNSHGYWFERRGRRRPSADVFCHGVSCGSANSSKENAMLVGAPVPPLSRSGWPRKPSPAWTSCAWRGLLSRVSCNF